MVTKSQLQSIDPYDFEELVAELWEAKGYTTHVREKSGDKGIDVEATRGGLKEVIQVKRYSGDNKIGSREVRRYATLYQQTNTNQVALVTSGGVTNQARELAPELGVEIIDGSQLVQELKENSISINDRFDYTDAKFPGNDQSVIFKDNKKEIKEKKDDENGVRNHLTTQEETSDEMYEKEDKLFKKADVAPDTMGTLNRGVQKIFQIIYYTVIGIVVLISSLLFVASVLEGEIQSGIFVSSVVFLLIAIPAKAIHYIIQRGLKYEESKFDEKAEELEETTQ